MAMSCSWKAPLVGTNPTRSFQAAVAMSSTEAGSSDAWTMSRL